MVHMQIQTDQWRPQLFFEGTQGQAQKNKKTLSPTTTTTNNRLAKLTFEDDGDIPEQVAICLRLDNIT